MVPRDWLDPLLQCAEETGAAYVTPVIYYGRRTPPVVHFAGGRNRLVHEEGRCRLSESYDHAGRPLEEVLTELDRRPTEMAEFHALLIRTEALRDLNGLDTRCPTAFEHNDLCLALAEKGYKGWLEPASAVNFLLDRATIRANWPYHLVRWSRSWIEESAHAFCRKWDLSPDDPRLVTDLESLHSRRRRPMRPIRKATRRIAGRGVLARIDRLTDWFVDSIVCARLDRKTAPVYKHSFPGVHA